MPQSNVEETQRKRYPRRPQVRQERAHLARALIGRLRIVTRSVCEEVWRFQADTSGYEDPR